MGFFDRFKKGKDEKKEVKETKINVGAGTAVSAPDDLKARQDAMLKKFDEDMRETEKRTSENMKMIKDAEEMAQKSYISTTGRTSAFVASQLPELKEQVMQAQKAKTAKADMATKLNDTVEVQKTVEDEALEKVYEDAFDKAMEKYGGNRRFARYIASATQDIESMKREFDGKMPYGTVDKNFLGTYDNVMLGFNNEEFAQEYSKLLEKRYILKVAKSERENAQKSNDSVAQTRKTPDKSGDER